MGLNISGLCSKTEQEPARKEQGVREESGLAWKAYSPGSKHMPLRPHPGFWLQEPFCLDRPKEAEPHPDSCRGRGSPGTDLLESGTELQPSHRRGQKYRVSGQSQPRWTGPLQGSAPVLGQRWRGRG